MSKTAGSILEATLKRDPHEVEFIQAVQEAVQALERVIAKNSRCAFIPGHNYVFIYQQMTKSFL